jgi:hypothetical protein
VRGTLSDGGDIRLRVADRRFTRRYRKQAQHYRDKGSRRGEKQWRARIESVMGACGRRQRRRRERGVAAAHVRSKKGRGRAGRCVGEVRGLRRKECPSRWRRCSAAKVKHVSRSSPEGGSTGREPQKIAVRSGVDALARFCPSACEVGGPKQTTITAKTSEPSSPALPLPLAVQTETPSSPWPTSPPSRSCSRPAWIPGATRKASHFSGYPSRPC